MMFILLRLKSYKKAGNALIGCGIYFHNSNTWGILIMLNTMVYPELKKQMLIFNIRY